MKSTLTLGLDVKTASTNAQLFAYIRVYGIKYKDLAILLDVSLHTIAKWRLPPTAKGHRRVPKNTLHYLKLLIFVFKTVPLQSIKKLSIVDVGILDRCRIPRASQEVPA